jgi:hypothetical protein
VSTETLDAETAGDTTWRIEAAAATKYLSAGMWAGILAGFVIGGIGGRLAMFVLRLTSDASLHGAKTDDGFIIGSFTASTFFLVGICTISGLLGGLLYLAVREWLPDKMRPWAMVVFFGAFGGAAAIRPVGIDFNALDPISLAVVMFISLPVLYGIALWWLTERNLARSKDRPLSGSIVAFLPLLGFGVAGPLGLIPLSILAAGWALNRSGVPIVKMWTSVPMTWVGRVAFVGATGFSLFVLGRDVVAVL